MLKKIRIAKADLAFIGIVIFLAGFIAGVTLAPTPTYRNAPADERVVRMILPAVDSEGNGVIATLYTTVRPGTGKILLDTSNVLNYIDTQLSSRTAAEAASEYARVNLSTIDIIYTIKVNASIIEGPSAGAAMALSVLLALDNRTADGIAITGTINPDGSIGAVGAVLQKTRAAKQYGTRIMLVPKGQSSEDESSRTKSCTKRGFFDVCKIDYISRPVNISSALDIIVREVGNIGEAYSFFNQTK